MNITRLKMTDLTGLSGMTVTHLVQETKDGFPFMVPTVAEPPYPVHLGLIKKFKELAVHLLNICDICQDPKLEMAKDYAIVDTEVTEITMNPDHFILKGHRKMGDKILTLKTYKVAAEDYLHFAGVQEIFKGIKEETEAYCAGNRQITIDELGERYITKLMTKGKKSQEDLDAFNAMGEEEKKAFCTKYLEDTGAIVIEASEIDLPDDTQVLKLKKTA